MSRATPVALFLMDTPALGTCAPDGSVTVPARVAPVTCAWIGVDTSPVSDNITYTKRPQAIFIRPPPRSLLGPRRPWSRRIDCHQSTVNRKIRVGVYIMLYFDISFKY